MRRSLAVLHVYDRVSAPPVRLSRQRNAPRIDEQNAVLLRNQRHVGMPEQNHVTGLFLRAVPKPRNPAADVAVSVGDEKSPALALHRKLLGKVRKIIAVARNNGNRSGKCIPKPPLVIPDVSAVHQPVRLPHILPHKGKLPL